MVNGDVGRRDSGLGSGYTEVESGDGGDLWRRGSDGCEGRAGRGKGGLGRVGRRTKEGSFDRDGAKEEEEEEGRRKEGKERGGRRKWRWRWRKRGKERSIVE